MKYMVQFSKNNGSAGAGGPQIVYERGAVYEYIVFPDTEGRRGLCPLRR